MSQHLHTADEDRPKLVSGPCGQRGYRNLKCTKCGQVIGFFVPVYDGHERKPTCRDCDLVLRVVNTAGNPHPTTHREIRRYHG